jgi:glyoxylase-like metal-dependent hydrolase (beta-lactamase superfamily II)
MSAIVDDVRARELAWAAKVSTTPSGVLLGDLAELVVEPWVYDDEFELLPGLTMISTPGHTPGHQALLVSFPDGRRFVCAGDAAYTCRPSRAQPHRPTSTKRQPAFGWHDLYGACIY